MINPITVRFNSEIVATLSTLPKSTYVHFTQIFNCFDKKMYDIIFLFIWFWNNLYSAYLVLHSTSVNVRFFYRLIELRFIDVSIIVFVNFRTRILLVKSVLEEIMKSTCLQASAIKTFVEEIQVGFCCIIVHKHRNVFVLLHNHSIKLVCRSFYAARE